MLMIRTVVRPSSIHGNGVFAAEAAAKGMTIWQYDPRFDRTISDEELASIPYVFKEFLEMYAYRSIDIGGKLVLSCDNARFLNHSADPNTEELPFRSVARKSIEIGDEITCDYGAFCSDGLGF